ncbi:MAG: TRAP transporter large permease subunit [Devosia sp.]
MTDGAAATGRLARLDRAIGTVGAALATISSVWILLMMVMICADIIGRGLFSRPLSGVPEVVAFSVPACVFLAIPYAIYTLRYLRADVVLGVIAKENPLAAALLELVFSLVGAAVFYKIVENVWPRLVDAWQEAEFFGAIGAFTAPVWPFTAALVVGATVALLQCLSMAAQKAAMARALARVGPTSSALVLVGAFLAVVGAGVLFLAFGDPSRTEVGLVTIAGLLVLVVAGLHIASALIVLSFVGIWLTRGAVGVADSSLAIAATGSINSYAFAVIPLFVLMGLFVDIANVGRDAFSVAAALLRRVRGGLGVATVFANAIFAAITGSSIASASVFTRVATPQMEAHGYTRRFAVGVVAGSSVLGMLIPPSLLLLVYGLIAEVSIGDLFIAGVVPGLLLAVILSLTVVGLAYAAPGFVGHARAANDLEGASFGDFAKKMLPVLLLIALVLGGLYAGLFTPTESGAVGAAGALVIAIARRSLTIGRLRRVLLEAAVISASILILMVAANLYSRMLTLTGIPQSLAGFMIEAQLGLVAFLALYLVSLILLGMVLDSVSIMLVMLPLMLPIVSSLGGDLVWFGIITVVAVEIGLLTPPFGIAVYVVKGALPPGSASLAEIFAGSFPFVVAMFAFVILLMAVPEISLWLLS